MGDFRVRLVKLDDSSVGGIDRCVALLGMQAWMVSTFKEGLEILRNHFLCISSSVSLLPHQDKNLT